MTNPIITEGQRLLEAYEAEPDFIAKSADDPELDLAKFFIEHAHFFLHDLPKRVGELEEGARWIASHDNFGLTDGTQATRKCIDALVQRAASLLSSTPEERTPEQKAALDELLKDDDELYDVLPPQPSGDVERVAGILRKHMPAQTKYWLDGNVLRAELVGPRDEGYIDPHAVARAVLSAMRPAIDREKVEELKTSAFKHMSDAMREAAHGSREIACRDMNAAEREVSQILAMLDGGK